MKKQHVLAESQCIYKVRTCLISHFFPFSLAKTVFLCYTDIR